VITSAVENVVALVKNRIPDFELEILRRDFTVDEAERRVLVNSAYDATHDFVYLYDLSGLVQSDDNNSPRAL
jgi:hypothetical protein